eukprot:m.208480 g.208480  ORF g.208480 m.208480 type:complete len:375 (-) comp18967_c0_seq6:33-1157(-)
MQVLHHVPEIAYLALALQSLRWSVDLSMHVYPLDGPMEPTQAASQVTGDGTMEHNATVGVMLKNWEASSHQMLCGARPLAVYSKSGQEIKGGKSCYVCPVRSRRVARVKTKGMPRCAKLHMETHANATSSTSTHVAFTEPLAALATAAPGTPRLWQLVATVGVVSEHDAIVSPERGATCQAILYDQDASRMRQFVGDLTYPFKVLFIGMPVGLVAMLLVVSSMKFVGPLAAPFIALASNLTDAFFLGATAVFPVCSVATSGHHVGVLDIVILGIVYACCAKIFIEVDRVLGHRFPLPQAVGMFHARVWIPKLAERMPSWMSLAVPAGTLYAWYALFSIGGSLIDRSGHFPSEGTVAMVTGAMYIQFAHTYRVYH